MDSKPTHYAEEAGSHSPDVVDSLRSSLEAAAASAAACSGARPLHAPPPLSLSPAWLNQVMVMQKMR